ncbi:MAG: hypothetical protein JW849_09215 [Phycisphaerae bacterium]|nr:hypothetical protein [Phycisphaerae bacterium]
MTPDSSRHRSDAEKGIETLVCRCAGLKAAQRVCVIYESATRELAERIHQRCLSLGAESILAETPPLLHHGVEPPEDVRRNMEQADVVFGLSIMSLAHSRAVRELIGRNGSYLSLPQYDWNVLSRPAMRTDFQSLIAPSQALAETLSRGTDLEIRTPAGTQLRCRIEGRCATPAPGCCYKGGMIASPPDAETNIPPREEFSEGVIVVDGSIPHPRLGVLDSPITLHVRGGLVKRMEGKQARVLEEIFAGTDSPLAYTIAEIGIGLNPNARLCGNMLEDEGVAGTVHIGIGANAALGGAIVVPFHLDHVLLRPTVRVDGREIICQGRFDSQTRPGKES